VAVLNQLDAAGFDWQVRGLREELVTALIRSLPKAVRKSFVPAPDHARAVLQRLPAVPDGRPLTAAVAAELREMTGVEVPVDAWDAGRVPEHLRVTFRVEDERGRAVGEDKDLGALQSRLATRVRAAVSQAVTTQVDGTGIERGDLRGWDLEALPRSVERTSASGHAVRGFPSLVDEGGSVAVRVLASEAEQRRAMWAGTRRLLMLDAPNPARLASAALDNAAKLALSHNPHKSVDALFEDCLSCAVDALVAEAGGPAWDPEGFARLSTVVRDRVEPTVVEVVRLVARILAEAHGISRAVEGSASLVLLPSLTDVRQQLAELVHPGFVTATGMRRLPDLLRYLRGISRRLEKLPEDAVRDRDRTGAVQRLEQQYAQAVARLPEARRSDEDVVAVRWMLQELRVSLFAQGLGTAHPVSEKRIQKALDRLTA
jgi:ATP-dependent helicase HrpA